MKLPMPFSPLSISEVHRRRAMRLSLFSAPSAAHGEADRAQNDEEETEA